MVTDKQKRKVAVKGGIYKLATSPGEKDYLIGSKCTSCGAHFYPKRAVCVYCYGQDMEEVPLSDRGKLWSYTIARQTYPGTLLTPPFVVANVELPERVYVTSLLTGVDFKDVRIGMDVELYFFKVTEDEEREVFAFAFRPSSGQK